MQFTRGSILTGVETFERSILRRSSRFAKWFGKNLCKYELIQRTGQIVLAVIYSRRTTDRFDKIVPWKFFGSSYTNYGQDVCGSLAYIKLIFVIVSCFEKKYVARTLFGSVSLNGSRTIHHPALNYHFLFISSYSFL